MMHEISGCMHTGAIAVHTFSGGTGSILLDVSCTGYEARLIDCDHKGIGVHNCRHFRDAGVRCQQLGMDLHEISY